MGGKRRKLSAKPHRHRPPPNADTPSPPKKTASSKGSKQHRQKLHEQPTIPFDRDDRILLIGEGDLSFAASLATHHGCRNLVATVLEESEKELLEKYPHAQANISAITTPPKTNKKSAEDDDDAEQDEWEDEDEDEETEENDQPNRNKIIYNIDATKPFPPSLTRPRPNRILFNFPHVGGKSTDVNRQVRHNQSLLVSFFRHALAALAPRGTVVITLFEAEPYTLWNPRDLARHAGLQVERSFRFQAGAYPGYRHARTLGVVRGKDGSEGAGWKGEERAARSYVFVRKGDDALPVKGRSNKRRRGGESDEDEDEEED